MTAAATTFGTAEVSGIPATQDSKITQQFKFVEIPLLARYKIIDQRIGFNIVGGFAANFLINNDAILDGSAATKGSTQNINKIDYSGTIGIGVNYKLFENIGLSFEPTYKYYINSITSNSAIKVHPYSFGVFTGLTYRF
jgi:hypothetical protein